MQTISSVILRTKSFHQAQKRISFLFLNIFYFKKTTKKCHPCFHIFMFGLLYFLLSVAVSQELEQASY